MVIRGSTLGVSDMSTHIYVKNGRDKECEVPKEKMVRRREASVEREETKQEEFVTALSQPSPLPGTRRVITISRKCKY